MGDEMLFVIFKIGNTLNIISNPDDNRQKYSFIQRNKRILPKNL